MRTDVWLCVLVVLFLCLVQGVIAASNPAVEWQKLLGGKDTEFYGEHILQTSDSGYILIAYTYSSASGDITGTNHGDVDTWVVKLDPYGTIMWQKLIGGSKTDSGYTIQRTSDGGYILAGSSGSSASGDVTGTNHGKSDVWVVKLDSAGTIQWQKLMGGSEGDAGFSIQQTSDGGYILAGSSASSASGDVTGTNHGTAGETTGLDIWVVKLDSGGTIQWQKLMGGTYSEWVPDIQLTKDGGFILIGSSQSGSSGEVTGKNHGDQDIWVVKLDSAGNIQWQKLIGGNSHEYGSDIRQTSDGGFILVGESFSSASGDVSGTNHGLGDSWVVKLDSAGNIQWQNLFGGSENDIGFSVDQTNDGGYIFAGCSRSSASGDVAGTTHGDQDIWVVKLDSAGTIQWQNLFGGNRYEYGSDIRQTTDGGYIFAGSSESSTSGDVTGINHGGFYGDVWVVKLKAGVNPGYYIQILPVDNKHAGEKFSINATTNLPIGEYVLVEVTCSSLNPTLKSKSDEFRGAAGTVTVQAGNSTINTTVFDVDLSGFSPDITECIVRESSGAYGIENSRSFVVEAIPPTMPPTTGPVPPTTTHSAAGPGPLFIIGAIISGCGIIRRIITRRR